MPTDSTTSSIEIPSPEPRANAVFLRHLSAAWDELTNGTTTEQSRVDVCLESLMHLLSSQGDRKNATDLILRSLDEITLSKESESQLPQNLEQILPRFTRRQPSEPHVKLMSLYQEMHANGYTVENGGQSRKMEAEDAYPGNELPKFAGHIKRLIDLHGSKSVLDYGSGKGKQYGPMTVNVSDGRVFESIPHFWEVNEVQCYDPCVPRFSNLPKERFDCVVSTDVLEHCYTDDVPWIVREMFSYARQFVFVNVACFPAIARLPTGENAHCTVKNPEWWFGLFHAISHEFHDIDYYVCCTHPATNHMGQTEFREAVMHRKAA